MLLGIGALFTAAKALVTPVVKKVAFAVAPVVMAKATQFVKEKFNEFVNGGEQTIRKSAEDIGETEAYNREEATLNDTKKIIEILNENGENVKGFTQSFETLGTVFIKAQLEKVTINIEEINKVKNNLIDYTVIERLKKEREEFLAEIDGKYTEEIGRIYSLGNIELLKILEENQGETKRKKMEDFAKKTLIDIQEKLKKEIENYMEKQSKFIEEVLDKYFSNLENNEKNIMSEIQKRERAKTEMEKNSLEKEYLNSLSILNDIKKFV